jgi:hypothetical protein
MPCPRLLLLTVGTVASLAACGGSTDPIASAELFAVNGARHPAVFATDTAVWAGFGFGVEQGAGNVFVRAGGLPATAEILSWADGEIRARLPADVEAGPSYVATLGDSLGPVDLFILPRTSYDPAPHVWAPDAALPLAVRQSAAAGVRYPAGATLTARVVLTGGRLADGRLNRGTYIATVAADGRVAGWQEAPDSIVPAGRWLHAMAGADRTTAPLQDVEAVAYMIGGVDSAGRVLADALGIGVSAGGAYSLWTPMAPLPDRRAGMATAVAYGKLYAIGGVQPDSLAARDVFYATILPNGTLSGWLVGPSLPEGRAFAAAAVAGSTLYVLGGERGIPLPDSVADSTQLTATVYAIPISPLSGAFRDSVWTELPVSLLHARSRLSAAVVDDALVVTGGVYLGMPSAGETEYATLGNGQLSAFQESPGPTLAVLAGGPVLGGAAPLLWNAQGIGRLTVIGGTVGGAPLAQVWSQ